MESPITITQANYEHLKRYYAHFMLEFEKNLLQGDNFYKEKFLEMAKNIKEQINLQINLIVNQISERSHYEIGEIMFFISQLRELKKMFIKVINIFNGESKYTIINFDDKGSLIINLKKYEHKLNFDLFNDKKTEEAGEPQEVEEETEQTKEQTKEVEEETEVCEPQEPQEVENGSINNKTKIKDEPVPTPVIEHKIEETEEFVFDLRKVSIGLFEFIKKYDLQEMAPIDFIDLSEKMRDNILRNEEYLITGQEIKNIYFYSVGVSDDNIDFRVRLETKYTFIDFTVYVICPHADKHYYQEYWDTEAEEENENE